MTYLCACGQRHTIPLHATTLARLWGSTRSAPKATHVCALCQRTNIVHNGVVTLSMPQGPPQKETP